MRCARMIRPRRSRPRHWREVARRGAPRPGEAGAFDLGDVSGSVRRRYMRGAERCDARAPIRITRCSDDTLELVVTDPVPPISFAPCVWPQPEPSHVERWHRE